MMSLLAPPSSVTSEVSGFEHLLLGDLRQLLEEPASPETSQWIVATLDCILAGRPRTSSPYLPLVPRNMPWGRSSAAMLPVKANLYAKLQRLRDRVAHRAPYALLANEIRCDLREWMEN